MKATLNLLGDNQNSKETNDTYLDYVKVRTTKTDCGGLKHVFDDILRFRKALDMIAYELLMRQTPRESTTNEMVTDKMFCFTGI